MPIKIVLSSPLRTLPQSLRDSSLPEGAFEKFSAMMFCSHRLFLRTVRQLVTRTPYSYNKWGDLVLRIHLRCFP